MGCMVHGTGLWQLQHPAGPRRAMQPRATQPQQLCLCREGCHAGGGLPSVAWRWGEQRWSCQPCLPLNAGLHGHLGPCSCHNHGHLHLCQPVYQHMCRSVQVRPDLACIQLSSMKAIKHNTKGDLRTDKLLHVPAI